MLTGAHVVVYSKNAEADRAFFRDVLGFRSVDAGHGWLIFAVPAAEVAALGALQELGDAGRADRAGGLEKKLPVVSGVYYGQFLL